MFLKKNCISVFAAPFSVKRFVLLGLIWKNVNVVQATRFCCFCFLSFRNNIGLISFYPRTGMVYSDWQNLSHFLTVRHPFLYEDYWEFFWLPYDICWLDYISVFVVPFSGKGLFYFTRSDLKNVMLMLFKQTVILLSLLVIFSNALVERMEQRIYFFVFHRWCPSHEFLQSFI